MILTTVIGLLGLCLLAREASAARPVETRISWLEGRAAFHRYVCRHGAHASKRFHCQALRWTRRELREARTERFYRLPPTGDWGVAVKIAQRVFPGTERWLLSCSKSEGGHGRWVRYGGGSYYPGYERTDAVGGWMQFRPSTYYAYAGRAIGYTKARGFLVPASASSWLSPLGQALTAGYMRAVVRNSGWHWQASIDRGCA